ncbi:MAG: hypothetical protein L3J79_01945 [Candidatus Marinimicrobia bacterium]|nr:hypothetical protein [Candidatus Neomarinimicrobiota bacterium]
MALLMGSVSILIGLFLLLAPDSLAKLGEQTNRFYNIDGLVFKNRKVFGSLLMLAALLLAYLTL